jgi:hypothetical protein
MSLTEDNQQDLSQNRRNIRIVPFALPSSSSSDPPENVAHKGVVGIVTFFGPSAFVWASWGLVEAVENNLQSSHDDGSIMGNGVPMMGSLGLAMPLKQSAGRQRDSSSCYTQLIGGTSDEDMILASGMASRLSAKSNFPVFVSMNIAGDNNTRDDASLTGDNTSLTSSYDQGTHEHSRWTVARIEREVTMILLQHKQQCPTSD